MNYILYAFLFDFLQNPLQGGVKRVILYLPFRGDGYYGSLAAARSLGHPV
jgi:hypothetical protein